MTAVAAPPRERPILFSAPMVRAILDGRKTQTRRVATPENSDFGAWGRQFWKVADLSRAWRDGVGSGSEYLHVPAKHGSGDMDGVVDRLRPRFAPARCWDQTPDRSERYAPPASVLWVRETWAMRNDVEAGTSKAIHYLRFAADRPSLDNEWHEYERWRPSIHMPRWASRLMLEITDVRVERLQAISEEDAKAEGVNGARDLMKALKNSLHGTDEPTTTHRGAFAALWDSLNAKRGFGWDANPFVWCITFARLTP